MPYVTQIYLRRSSARIEGCPSSFPVSIAKFALHSVRAGNPSSCVENTDCSKISEILVDWASLILWNSIGFRHSILKISHLSESKEFSNLIHMFLLLYHLCIEPSNNKLSLSRFSLPRSLFFSLSYNSSLFSLTRRSTRQLDKEIVPFSDLGRSMSLGDIRTRASSMLISSSRVTSGAL